TYGKGNFIIAAAKNIAERILLEQELSESRDNLEKLVYDRTKDLNATQDQLEQTIRELQRSNEELQHFAYVASHDLQEPIRMIASYLQLIEKRYIHALNDDAQQYIDFAIDGAMRMGELIKDLLEYSRVGRKYKGVNVVRLSTILELVQFNLAKNIERSHAEISIIGQLPEVQANKTLMLRLFQNLIHNALKFRSAESPRIIVQALELEHAFEFSIKDNGIGIPESDQERIFVIFQRLHRREEYPGTGIGLAMCKKIAQYHGGDIRVESRPGEGSNFIFTISKTLKKDLSLREHNLGSSAPVSS
ncbi:MAG: ATP-binding protein, partial [Bacteroidota bacterium]